MENKQKTSKIPMKMRVIEYLSQNSDSCIEDIMKGLVDEYGKEGQFNKSNFDHMMAAMKAVGIIKNSTVELDDH